LIAISATSTAPRAAYDSSCHAAPFPNTRCSAANAGAAGQAHGPYQLKIVTARPIKVQVKVRLIDSFTVNS